MSHYFADKRDLVSATYAEVGDRVAFRLESAARTVDPLRDVLRALLPLDSDRTRDWRLLFTFLGVAATDTELGDEQRSRAATARDRIAAAVATEQEAGTVRADVRPRDAARHLLALVLGIGMQALFDPADWSARRMRTAVDSAIAELRP